MTDRPEDIVQRIGVLSPLFALALSGLLVAPALAPDSPAGSPSPGPVDVPPSPVPSSLPSSVSEARRPDIVLFYLDDYSPRPRSLFDDPERTPNLARFANNGVRFDNAIVSTPLCGPSRAGLLTGRYGHSTGVVGNDATPYTTENDVADKLSKVGYRTLYVGKHLNFLAKARPTREQMDRLAEDWDAFDVMWEDQGRFYDWTQYRKDGLEYYGTEPGDHSSRIAAERAIEHIEATPADQPLLLIVSLADGHVPITPMKRHVGHPACADFEPWQGPAFNEADVSDKPSFLQATPPLQLEAYDLVARCEQTLTVDWVVGKVTRALRDAGRLEDTLQVVTADNGWLMGDHRIVGKSYPYATSVPLFVRWPAAGASDRRVVEDPVTNLDWLPTFCELAGCGVPHADGLSLVPLITGRRDRLEREFVYFELLYDNPRYPDDPSARPAYSGVETTLGYSDTRWSFTRYSNGEAELYDLSEDPNRLENLFGREGYGKITRKLQRFHKSIKHAHDVEWVVSPNLDEG